MLQRSSERRCDTPRARDGPRAPGPDRSLPSFPCPFGSASTPHPPLPHHKTPPHPTPAKAHCLSPLNPHVPPIDFDPKQRSTPLFSRRDRRDTSHATAMDARRPAAGDSDRGPAATGSRHPRDERQERVGVPRFAESSESTRPGRSRPTLTGRRLARVEPDRVRWTGGFATRIGGLRARDSDRLGRARGRSGLPFQPPGPPGMCHYFLSLVSPSLPPLLSFCLHPFLPPSPPGGASLMITTR